MPQTLPIAFERSPRGVALVFFVALVPLWSFARRLRRLPWPVWLLPLLWA